MRNNIDIDIHKHVKEHLVLGVPYSGKYSVYASGDTTGLIDTIAIRAAITLAGVGGKIELFGGSSDQYHIAGGFDFLLRQKFFCNDNTLRFINQITVTATATTVFTSGATSTVVNVPSTTGFFVGMEFGFEDRTVAGQTTFNSGWGVITAIGAGTITVNWANTHNAGLTLSRWDTATALETTPGSPYTANIGTVYHNTVYALRNDAADVLYKDVRIDGNRTNYAYGRYWATSGGGDVRGVGTKIRGMTIIDSPSDAIAITAPGFQVSDLNIVKANGLGIHFGASGVSLGGSKGVMANVLIDSVGMIGDYSSGHYGGRNADPMYQAIAHSRNTNDYSVTGFGIYNTYSSTRMGGIGLFSGADNNRASFNNGIIRGMTHGAWDVTNAEPAGNPVVQVMDPRAGEIHFNSIDVYDCTDSVFTALSIDHHTRIGFSSAAVKNVRADLVKVTNVNFLDSPFIIDSTGKVDITNVTLRATSCEKSSTLIVYNQNSSKVMDVRLNNVISIRPRGFNGPYQSGWNFLAQSYPIYIDLGAAGGRISGVGVTAIGGDKGFYMSNCTNEIVDLTCIDQYSTGAQLREGATHTLNTPKIRLNQSSSITTVTAANVNITTNTVTTATAVAWTTGMTCQYYGSSGGAMAGLAQENTLFVINVDDSNYRFATSLTNALAGTAIDITTQGTGTHTFALGTGVTSSGSYIGIDNGESTAAKGTINNPDIEIYARYTSQTGVRQSQATTGRGTLIIGGKIVSKGTNPISGAAVDGISITPSGNVNGRNQCVYTAVYPSYTPTAGTDLSTSVTLTNV